LDTLVPLLLLLLLLVLLLLPQAVSPRTDSANTAMQHALGDAVLQRSDI
jgi:hypothetical protein